MARRFSDSLPFASDGVMPPPQSARGLLFDLHLETSSRPDQERGIRDWIARNEPSVTLRASLIRNGFGHLLGFTTAG